MQRMYLEAKLMQKSLAVKYRPTKFDDVVEQKATRQILVNQLENSTFKQAYLFVGPAGCGKTTTARIFANEVNGGSGVTIEIDAASHGNVNDIREIGVQAKLKPVDSLYKVFIIDECHCLSAAGWSAMLKLIEEPPATAIFIFCTTDVQKVPKTIMSRCQRFDFTRISLASITARLKYICEQEHFKNVNDDALEYIAKLSDGGMRDAITLLDKSLAYNTSFTIEDVITALGTVDYDVMFNLTDWILKNEKVEVFNVIENEYRKGKDLKLFVKNYIQFLLDTSKLYIGCAWEYTQFPKRSDYVQFIDSISEDDFNILLRLLDKLVILQSDIKYSSSPKYDIEATLLLI